MDEELKKEHQGAYTYHFFFNQGLFEEIMHLQDFINSIDEFLNEKLALKKEEENAENYDPRFNAENQFGNIFPNILWRTTFLHSYFLLESSLDQICKNIQEAESYAITLKEMHGRGIQRASLYLRKACNIKTPFETDSWNQMQDFNKVRNVFVHADGIIEKSNKDLIKIASKYEGLSLTGFDELGTAFLGISKPFTIYSLERVENFFQDIYQNMRPQTR